MIRIYLGNSFYRKGFVKIQITFQKKFVKMKYLTILLVTCFFASVTTGDSDSNPTDLDEKWEIFKDKFNRSYSSPDEEHMRKKNFLDSIERLSALNTRDGSAKFWLTTYSDKSKEEKKQMLGLKIPQEIPQGLEMPKSTNNDSSSTGTTIDWRYYNKNAVLPQVKDQGSFATGWAFACAGALEGAYAINSGNLVSLSEQDILDCLSLVSVDSDMGWFDYFEGIFEGPCLGKKVNHAVTIVGFTTDAWIIRNSWGEKWGDKGYMQIRKGKNTCFIENYSLAPAM